MKKNTNKFKVFLFLLIAALIIVGCGGGLNSKGSGGGKPDTPIQKKIDEIIKAWENATKFDMALYESQMDDVHRWENNKMFKHTECETLRGTIREYAIQTAYYSYDSALVNWTDSSEIIMNQNYNGLRKVKKDFGIETNVKIAEVEQIHTLYNEAVGFVRGNFEIYPNFNPKNVNMPWLPFNVNKKVYTDRADSLKSNKYFPRIENVPEISQGVIRDLNSKLESKRGGYYCGLVTLIKKYFDGLNQPLSQGDWDDLSTFYYKLDGEASSFGLSNLSCLSNLADYKLEKKPAN